MNATTVRPLNAKPSEPDVRDFKFIGATGPLPTRFDLRQFVVSVEDQGQEGSCTAFALKNNLQMMCQAKGEYEQLSAQFQYYDVGDLEKIIPKEGRYSLRDGLEAARRNGICLESEWPYTPGNENVKPSDAAWASAATRKVLRYEAVDLAGVNLPTATGGSQQAAVDNIKRAIVSGHPVMFGAAIGSDFFKIHGPLNSQFGQYGDITWPGHTGPNPYAGFHAMNIVGFDDALSGFIVLNQWSAAWGDRGFGLLPYRRLVDFTEAWVVQSYKDIDLTDPALALARAQVTRFFVGILGRAPRISGLNYWVNSVQSGTSLADACAGFLASPECRDKFPSDAAVFCDAFKDMDAFSNKVAVALYCAVDLACDKLTVSQVALNGVTADPVTVDAAKANVRRLLSDGVL